MSIPLKIEYNLSDIVRGCKMGTPSWQKMLYEQYYGFAFSICMRFAASKDDAVELVNDGFVKVFRGISDFIESDDSNIMSKIFMSWFKRIMINTSINHSRSVRQKLNLSVGESSFQDTSGAFENPLNEMAYMDLVKLIQKLSPAYRNTFSLFAIEGYSHEQIAKTLGISVGASKSNLLKARKNLRKMLEQINE